MARRYGRCPRGERLLSSAPWGHWKTTTFVAALRIGEVTAPCVLDGPMDGESFRAYVEQCLVPTLRQGDIVVMDNLASHKVAGIKQAIEGAGAELRTYPRTAPISIRSSSYSPRSRRCCKKLLPGPTTPSSRQSPTRSLRSLRPNAETTLQTRAIAINHEDALGLGLGLNCRSGFAFRGRPSPLKTAAVQFDA
jgi:transposase